MDHLRHILGFFFNAKFVYVMNRNQIPITLGLIMITQTVISLIPLSILAYNLYMLKIFGKIDENYSIFIIISLVLCFALFTASENESDET